ncbi:MAG: protein translocase subunit SecF, partial [Alphaproteobacteria bacterium]|nr:protein translocase subunit SecF [Alphaproteobacteria bacterium]
RSLNETLSRTIMTSTTTLLALVALYVFGGEVIANFAIAMIWGVIVGTYSTAIISTALLVYLPPRRPGTEDEEAKATEAASG